MSVSQAEIFFVRGANTEMKMNGAIVGYSATEQKKFRAREWAALIRCFEVEAQKKVQNFGSNLRKIVMQRRCTPSWSHKSREKIDVDRQSRWMWFGNDVMEDIWKCRFTYALMENMEKPSR